MVELAPIGSNYDMRISVDENVLTSSANSGMVTSFSSTTNSSYPLIGGKQTGTLSQGQMDIFKIPDIYLVETQINRLYSFILTMPSNADFDLYLIELATGSVLASALSYSPGVTEQFYLSFPSWIVGNEIGVLIHAYSGSGTYTVYAGSTWKDRDVNGNVLGGHPFWSSVNWPAPGTYSLDLRNHVSVPKDSYITTLSTLGTSTGGNINRSVTFVDQGGTINGMFDALPIPRPSFQSGNTWYQNPVSGRWADQRMNFAFSVISIGPNWSVTNISMSILFPVTPQNLNFV
jgi:hypothetical protein